MTDWWRRGDTCEVCGIWFCQRHSPIERADPRTTLGPLGTTGFETVRIGPIEVLVLDNHTSGGERTRVGEAVYQAKYANGRLGSPSAASGVAAACCHWLQELFNSAQRSKPVAVVAVPAKTGQRGRSLPALIAAAVSQSLDVPLAAPLRWKQGTAQAKDLPQQERERVLEGMLEQTGEVLSGEILLVDDILQSGATISVVARALKRMGAGRVIAVAPTQARSYGRGTSSPGWTPRRQSYTDLGDSPL